MDLTENNTVCNAYVLGTALLGIGVMACASPQANEFDAPPSETTWCQLSIGETTVDEARDVLGKEWTSTSVPEFTRLTYQYGEVPDAVFVSLTFDDDGVFKDAAMMGAPFPACWKVERDGGSSAN